MAISYRTSASNYTTAVTTNSLTIPGSIADGDLLVLYCLSSSANCTIDATTFVDAWQQIRVPVTNVNTYMWAKRAATADIGSTVTVDYNISASGTLGLVVIAGLAYIRWVAVPQNGTLPSSILSTNTYTGRNADIALYLGASRVGAGSVSPSFTTGTSAVQRTDTTLGGIAINYLALSGDTTPTPTMTQATTGVAGLDIVMIAPAPDTLVLPDYSIATTNAHLNSRILKGRMTSTTDDAAGA